jgi:hypothetical protein
MVYVCDEILFAYEKKQILPLWQHGWILRASSW